MSGLLKSAGVATRGVLEQAASASAPPSRIASFLIEDSPSCALLRTGNWQARARFLLLIWANPRRDGPPRPWARQHPEATSGGSAPAPVPCTAARSVSRRQDRAFGPIEPWPREAPAGQRRCASGPRACRRVLRRVRPPACQAPSDG